MALTKENRIQDLIWELQSMKSHLEDKVAAIGSFLELVGILAADEKAVMKAPEDEPIPYVPVEKCKKQKKRVLTLKEAIARGERRRKAQRKAKPRAKAKVKKAANPKPTIIGRAIDILSGYDGVMTGARLHQMVNAVMPVTKPSLYSMLRRHPNIKFHGDNRWSYKANK